MINIKRSYLPPEEGDGLRILVDRIWPRGVSKKDFKTGFMDERDSTQQRTEKVVCP